MKQYGKDDKQFYLEFDNMEDATDYRDFLRDCGFYASFMPDRTDYVLVVRFADLVEAFEKDFLRNALEGVDVSSKLVADV